MGRVAPAVAAVRTAVRTALRDAAPPAAAPPPTPPPSAPALPADRPLALVACSGGADSMALAEAAGFAGARLGWRVGVVTVDHGLQDGSRARAEAVATWARRAGFAPVEVLPVTVSGRGGPEAAARDTRYRALAGAAAGLGASAVLLGHTRDDQAETVLLALARGAGPRGLAGMPARRERDGVLWLRPLLSVRRDQTRAACAALGLEYWDDPHNTDPAYARARVRTTALPALVEALGDRVVDNLARTAAMVAADDAALTQWARRVLADLRTTDRELPVAEVRDLPTAVRTRLLHAWARDLGVPGAALSHRHIAALDALVSDWHGQGPAYLPGSLVVRRRGDRLRAEPPGGGATVDRQV